jgi:hypothetical protein
MCAIMEFDGYGRTGSQEAFEKDPILDLHDRVIHLGDEPFIKKDR